MVLALGATATLGGPSFAASAPAVVTAVGGGGGGAGVTVAQDPVALAAEPSGGLDVGDGTLMVVRELLPTGTERNAACAGIIASSGYGGDGGPAGDAACDGPYGLAVDHAGDLYMADYQNNRVRVVAASSSTLFGVPVTGGQIVTVAGNGTWGHAGDGGPAARAELAYPAGIALDGSGNLVIADSGNDDLRVVAGSTGTFYGQAMSVGDIYTVAGDGTAGSGGDGTAATGAELDQPTGVAVDGHGNLVVADLGNNEVRVVAATSGTFYGRSMRAGEIDTVAGDGRAGWAHDGTTATAAELDRPSGVAIDSHGDVVVAELGDNRVQLLAGTGGSAFGAHVRTGGIYTIAGTGGAHFSGDGGPAVHAALSAPQDVVVDASGNVVIADSGNNRVRIIAASTGSYYGRIVTAGTIATIAGTGAPGGYSGNGGDAPDALLNLPTGVAADDGGDVVVADQNNNRVRFVPAASGTHFGRPMISGRLYTIAGNGTAGSGTGGGGGISGPGADTAIDTPAGVAFDRAGNVVIAEFAGNRIRVVADRSGRYFGRSMVSGNMVTVAGTGSVGSTGDGHPAVDAEIDGPENITVDAFGNLVFTELYGNRVRVVAARKGTFYGQPMTTGDIYTVAGTGSAGSSGDGGPATAATFQLPIGVTVDRFGNLVVGDYLNDRVRVVATATGTFYGVPMRPGDVYTVAGTGARGSAGTGGPATQAQLSSPAGVTVDGTGNIIIADSAGQDIRAVAVVSGRFFGQDMVAGDLYTVAGQGSTGCPNGIASDSPADAIALSEPLGVAYSAAGALFISDTANNCVRQLTVGPEAPGPPRSVRAAPGPGGVTVRWSRPSGEGTGPVTGYVVTASDGTTVRVGASSTSATMAGLPAGSADSFTVSAVGAVGPGPASAHSATVAVGS